jgi:hypothetical protein
LRNWSILLFRLSLSCFLLVAVACDPHSKRNQQNVSQQSRDKQTSRPATPTPKESARTALSSPPSETPGQRIRKLWAESKLVIKADAEAKLSEAEYQARREPLFRTWLDLQSQLSMLGRPDGIMGERAVSEILALINRVYGYPGYSETERQQRRRNTDVMTELLRLDRRVKTLP